MPNTIPFGGGQPGPAKPQTLPFGTGTSPSASQGTVDQSMAVLAHSQSTHDQLRQKAQQDLAASTAASQQANSPATIAAETAKGTVGGLANNALRFVQSAVHAPADIYNSLTGKQQDQSVQPNFTGEGQQTFQGEFQSKTIPAVESGQADPRAATLGTVGNVVAGGADVLGLEGAGKLASGAMDYLGKTKLGGIVQDFAAKRAEKAATQTAIQAVDPALKGTKLADAYGNVVKGQRDVIPRSVFREQGLTPDQKSIALGTRLKDLPLTKDPAKNISVLGKALQDTEVKLDAALKGDPSLVYNADKVNLYSKLEAAKQNIPEEYKGIKDNKTVFNNAIDFMKAKIAEQPDTIEGLRDARTAFDAKAKENFPSAYRGEFGIDTGTPAGAAIKLARDTVNGHMYDTAPNGSELQNLIGREADIFRATEGVKPRAAALHGENSIQKLIAKHPYLAGFLGYGLLKEGDSLQQKVTGVHFLP